MSKPLRPTKPAHAKIDVAGTIRLKTLHEHGDALTDCARVSWPPTKMVQENMYQPALPGTDSSHARHRRAPAVVCYTSRAASLAVVWRFLTQQHCDAQRLPDDHAGDPAYAVRRPPDHCPIHAGDAQHISRRARTLQRLDHAGPLPCRSMPDPLRWPRARTPSTLRLDDLQHGPQPLVALPPGPLAALTGASAPRLPCHCGCGHGSPDRSPGQC